MTKPDPLGAHMTELVSVDMDLPVIPRWQLHAIQFPHAASFLAKKYGTKEDVEYFKNLGKAK